MNRTMTADLDRHITGNYGEDSVARDGEFCIWEDCDQEPVYCPGHACEFANVTDENEATRLRADNERDHREEPSGRGTG
jgi:hypothetical protein